MELIKVVDVVVFLDLDILPFEQSVDLVNSGEAHPVLVLFITRAWIKNQRKTDGNIFTSVGTVLSELLLCHFSDILIFWKSFKVSKSHMLTFWAL